jgi:hypothetical protein
VAHVAHEIEQPPDTAKHVRRWLAWDGSYALDGDANRRTNRSRAPTPVSPGDAVATDGVSVRLERVDAEFDPRRSGVAILVKLKRAWLVRALLLRVYRNESAELVYQEVLSAADIERLPATPPSVSASSAARARREDSPYRVVVWVSKHADAFAAEPVEKYEETVHDRSVATDEQAKAKHDVKTEKGVAKTDWVGARAKLDAKKEKVAKNEVGVNLTSARET